jgi:hypothetical protein
VSRARKSLGLSIFLAGATFAGCVAPDAGSGPNKPARETPTDGAAISGDAQTTPVDQPSSSGGVGGANAAGGTTGGAGAGGSGGGAGGAMGATDATTQTPSNRDANTSEVAPPSPDATPTTDGGNSNTDAAPYPLQYEQTFSAATSLMDMVFANPGGWQHDATGGVGSLSLFRAGGYSPPFRSPTSIALVATKKFGSFVMELEVMQTGAEYGHRDFCLFFGFQDPSHFYYAHVASAQDGVSHEIHIVNNADRRAITSGGNKGYDWGRGVWRRLRLVRDVQAGTIEVYGEGQTAPILTANSKVFAAGYVGFGSFDDTGRIRNVRVWAAETIDGRPNYFTAK